ncbi:hypothetical protein [Micrococcus luteus]|nr:hypothetical protein [Micrococcus luteus]
MGGIVLISGPSTVNPAPRVVVGRPGHTPDNRLPNHLLADSHED